MLFRPGKINLVYLSSVRLATFLSQSFFSPFPIASLTSDIHPSLSQSASMSVQIIYFLCRIQRRKYLLKMKHDEKLTMSIFRKTNKVAKPGLHVSGHFLSNYIPRQFDSNMLRDVPRFFCQSSYKKKIQTSLTSSSTFQYTSLRYKFFIDEILRELASVRAVISASKTVMNI